MSTWLDHRCPDVWLGNTAGCFWRKLAFDSADRVSSSALPSVGRWGIIQCVGLNRTQAEKGKRRRCLLFLPACLSPALQLELTPISPLVLRPLDLDWNYTHISPRTPAWRCQVMGQIPKSQFFTINLYKYAFLACMLSHYSHVWLFATAWIVAHQAALSMGFSRQEYWSGLPRPPPGDLPTQGSNGLLHHRWFLYRLSHQESLIGIYLATIQATVTTQSKYSTIWKIRV